MAVDRFGHIGIVVRDLPAATAFFAEIGLQPQGGGRITGDWVGRVIGLTGVETQVEMLATPDGAVQLELIAFASPKAIDGAADAPSNALGIRHITISVDDLNDTVARLQERHGAQLVGTIEQYEDQWLLCYLRGPEGIIVELGQRLSPRAGEG